MTLDMQIAADRLNAHITRVERRNRAEAQARVRSGLSRRGLMGSIGACVGLAMVMAPTVSKAAFNTDIVDIKRLGAVGDGVTDDTAAIQRALNLKAHCYAPPGNYLFSSPLSFAVAGQRLFGAGLGATVFTASSGFSGSAYPQGNSAFYFGQFQPGPQIADLRLTCATPGTVAVGVNAINSARFKITNCRITMFVTCLNMTGNCGGSDINGLEIWAGANSNNNGLAVYVDGSLDTVHFNGLRIWPFDDPGGGTFTASITSNVLTVTSAPGNFLAVGQTITAAGVNCTITGFGTGTGGTGAYNVTNANVGSRSMVASGIPSFITQTGIISGRCDGLFITNSMAICLNQINLNSGIGAGTTFTGTTNGTTSLIVTGISSGTVQVGATLFIAGVSQGVTIVSGAGGGNGTYVMSGTVAAAGPTTMHTGDPGATFGGATNFDFDSFNGVIMNAGFFGLSDCLLTGAAAGAFGVTATNQVTVFGGKLNIAGCQFFSGANAPVGVALAGGEVTINGSNFTWVGNTVSAISASAGTVVCDNNVFSRTSGIGGSYLIAVSGTGLLTAMGNRMATPGGTVNFIQTTVDNWHVVAYNSSGNGLNPGTPTYAFTGSTFNLTTPNK